MNDAPREKEHTPRARSVWLPVAAVVVTGLVINWLSEEIVVSPPILLLLAAIALALLVAAERSKRVELPFSEVDLDFTKLALLALLLGALIGAISIIPLFQERTIWTPWGFFHNYELGAAAAIAILSSISAVRLREPAQWLVFLAASVAGMTLTVVYMKSGNTFLATFTGWLAATTLVTTLVANARDLVRVLLRFLGFAHRDESTGPTQTSGVSPEFRGGHANSAE